MSRMLRTHAEAARQDILEPPGPAFDPVAHTLAGLRGRLERIKQQLQNKSDGLWQNP
jgi:hypothetical protein